MPIEGHQLLLDRLIYLCKYPTEGHISGKKYPLWHEVLPLTVHVQADRYAVVKCKTPLFMRPYVQIGCYQKLSPHIQADSCGVNRNRYSYYLDSRYTDS